MKGMKAKLTSSETANDPNSRINKSLRAWNCHADGGEVWENLGPKRLENQSICQMTKRHLQRQQQRQLVALGQI
jgi:hypothetical protein